MAASIKPNLCELENTVVKLRNMKRGSARRVASGGGVSVVSLVTMLLTGCPSSVLPDSATFSEIEAVTVAEGVTAATTLGAGAASLADSTWSIHKASDDSLLFRIEFGSNGEVERVFDSFVFAKEWLGSEIIPDTQAHDTDVPGGRYISGAYAAERNGSVGVLGVIHGILLGAHIGTATLSFWGPFEAERINGTMNRNVTVFAETPFLPPRDAVFDAYALRDE